MEAYLDDEYGCDEEPDGQLLLEIIRKEEDRDLQELVSDMCARSAVYIRSLQQYLRSYSTLI